MMNLKQTDLQISHLCLGGNVFGWSASPSESEMVLDYFADHGGNFIDTADMYSQWAEGNVGGESERILGHWMKRRGNRSSIVVATKVAKQSARPGLSANNIQAACDDSLKRLQTDYIDLYYAHQDDPETPLEETLEAFNALVQAGKVRYLAVSNFSAERLQQSLELSAKAQWTPYVASQDHYNLLDRGFEERLRPTLEQHGLTELPYFGLARGFLTGKYRPGKTVESVRASGVVDYQSPRGWAMLGHLDEIAQEHNTSVAAVALAWLRAQPTVAAPIASARTLEQVREIMPCVELSSEELDLLTGA